MDVLSALFGSESRVRMMRLFLFNPENCFDLFDVCDKSKISSKDVKKEFLALEKATFIKRKDFYKTIKKVKNGKTEEIKNKVHGYCLNKDFTYMSAIKQLLINSKTFEDNELVKKLTKIGKIKLLIVSGVFIDQQDSRVDILIVGNNLNKTTMNKVIKSIEAELGKELVYAFFETSDFEYRLQMFDKLVRDIIDFPHQVLLNKLQVQI